MEASESASSFVETDSELETDETSAMKDGPTIIVKIGAGNPVVDEVQGTEPYVPVMLPGAAFYPGAGHEDAARKADRVLGPNSHKMNTNRTALWKAKKVAEEAKANLNHYRHKVWYDTMVHGNALVETESEVEQGTEAATEAEVDAEDLPPVNPDMVPIPEAVHDILAMEKEKPIGGFPDTPVYIVQEMGKNFVPQGDTFTAQVGPGGSKMADYILERATSVDKLKKHYKPLMSAKNASESAADQLTVYRAIINQPFEDAKASPEVVADLKPVINYSYLESGAELDMELDSEIDAELDAEESEYFD